MSIHLCVLLWAHPDAGATLAAYEDRVLALMPAHGARVVQRARTNGADNAPLEIQILEFPTQASLDGYLGDERRTTLTRDRDAAIARTEILPVDLV